MGPILHAKTVDIAADIIAKDYLEMLAETMALDTKFVAGALLDECSRTDAVRGLVMLTDALRLVVAKTEEVIGRVNEVKAVVVGS